MLMRDAQCTAKAVAQGRSCLDTLGSKVGTTHTLGALGLLMYCAAYRGLNNYQDHFEVYLKYETLWPCWEHGTKILAIEAPSVSYRSTPPR